MKRHERGQGLVEYALILVLVAIVVVGVLALIGSQIGGTFCEIVIALNGPYSGDLAFGVHVESMGTSDVSVDIDVKDNLDEMCLEYVWDWNVDSPPSYGTVDDNEDGTFTYRRNDVSSGADDRFTYGVRFITYSGGHSSTSYIGSVIIIVGEEDPSVSESSIMRIAEQTNPELDDVEENILTLLEEAEEQEESIDESVDLTVEAVEEGLEVLIDFADDINNQVLSETLSQLLQEVKDGNLDAVSDVVISMWSDLAEAPLEVYLAMALKITPRIIESCEALSDGTVSPETIAEAREAVEQLDEDHPGKTEALELLQEAVDIVEERNIAIELHSDLQLEIIDMIISLLEFADELDLAGQLAADSEACSE